ncbi:MAG: DNA-binding response regulator [Planctomycetaceae bacterium]|nr:MAG: DNA-binding response regulator [Planctomycetaceae bacterium]RPI89554.1 MAG: DNA-binding response regulator [Planctomycetaceae bacterium]
MRKTERLDNDCAPRRAADSARVIRFQVVGEHSMFISKRMSTDEVLQAVRDVAAGGTYVSPQMTRKVLLQPESSDGGDQTSPLMNN